MKIFKLFSVPVLLMIVISGCVSVDPVLRQFESKETKLVRQYVAKGEALEKESRLSSALEQYKLALTVDPGSEEALQHRENVLSKLWEKAQWHYKKGLALDSQGKFDAARKEYLSALQNWPDYKEAKAKLTPGSVTGSGGDYIVHTLKYGESVSQLAKIYYGDFKKHTIIGKFNVLKDVTKVRVGEKLKIPVTQNVSLKDLKLKQKNYLGTRKLSIPVVTKKEPEKMPEPEIEEKIAMPEPVQMPVVEEPEPEPEKMITEKQIIEETMPVEEAPKTAVSAPSPEKEISMESEEGVALFNQKEYARATPLLTAALETDPENENLREYLFTSHFQQGLALFNAKKYLSAKDHFESALMVDKTCEKCPDYIEKCEETYKDKHYNLGIHYFGKEQLEKAIEEWKKVKEIDPGYKEVTPNLKKAELLFKRLESIKQGSAE